MTSVAAYRFVPPVSAVAGTKAVAAPDQARQRPAASPDDRQPTGRPSASAAADAARQPTFRPVRTEDDRASGRGTAASPRQADNASQSDGNVVHLRPQADRAPEPRAGHVSPPFTPFIAQQVAQEWIDDDGGAPAPLHVAAANAAYRLAAGDTGTVLGPVRPAMLTV